MHFLSPEYASSADGAATAASLLDAIAEGAAIARSDPKRAAALLYEGSSRQKDLSDLEV